jgi:hypothetical protein
MVKPKRLGIIALSKRMATGRAHSAKDAGNSGAGISPCGPRAFRTILLMLTALASASCAEIRQAIPDRPHGVLVVGQSEIPEYIYPVFMVEVDGTTVRDRRSSWVLEPGDHEIVVAADLSRATGSVRGGYTSRDEQPGRLKIFVEAGMKYWIGARFTGGPRDQWEAVIYREAPLEYYNHSITRM